MIILSYNVSKWDVQIQKLQLRVTSEPKSALEISINSHRRETNLVSAPSKNKLFNNLCSSNEGAMEERCRSYRGAM